MSGRTELKRLQDICTHFGVADIYELHQLNLEHDQKLIKNCGFDPQNTALTNNQIKDKLASLSLINLPEAERKAVQNILWLWYHHATTVCIWQKRDLKQARIYCSTALSYLYEGHPNRITPVLCMLLNGEIDAARLWTAEKVNEIERPYAEHLLAEYEKGTFN
ncbi:hypothetical protein A3H77_00380 [Candidatus Kaiserbacteria bacterium RIFCSPLOWO2_02_FULL_56_11]|uniref:Uncharacterized protein n=2 Tax=Candidatus Kaiseribacteriota TaxID=1752734 RepID=A0A1F6E2A8_9BACT|nr:MAG: hypothetical protein A3C95_02160 [Candidatus Kaiserbacteria bacterium RIFCSPHIGHO2_02_FULL_56_30]OGG71839.1 MAG: hypothetical protein A3E65_02790 [Candidatus Kaiserbacteria bacterium RIFCSPHIGHO2_12_FULL_56_13]OGG81037.1 MAG: hypothetical protein A3H77_00380 [Candidatus Kaiserbacteria bacterium RIFCSPLOWO2_02_FULL_56_11]